jgi:uncharacterized membrane protein
MQWYYAIDGQRHGPISEQEFAQLIANGTITGETLVWRQGIDQWAPWSTLAASNPLPEVGAGAPPMPPPSSHGGGASQAANSPEWDLESFTERLHVNGYTTSVGGILGRAWDTYKNAFGACLGVTVVSFIIQMVVGLIPFVSLIAIFLVTPQLTGGVMWYFLQRHRGQDPAFDVMFEGFSRKLGALALVALIQLLLTVLFAIPIGILAAIYIPLVESGGNEAVALLGGLGLFVVSVIIGALLYRFILAHLIVMDLNISAIDAFKLSWRIMGKRFWTMIGLALVLMALSIAGLIALFIGFIFVLPIFYSSFAQAYEDACQSAAGTPPQD